jgi:outer membrane lipoprotein-sorting protein
MHLPRIKLLLGLILFLCASVTAQQNVKDTNAYAVLAQMAAATGWSRASNPSDVLATGTMTRYRGEQQDTAGITLKARGPRKLRIELQEPSSSRTSIVNGNGGILSTPEGTRRIPSHVAASEQPLVFPFLTDLAAANDDGISLSYLGIEDVRGEAAHRIEIIREPAADYPAREDRRKAIALTVWVSVARGVPVQIQYNLFAFDNPTSTFPATRYLSDYRRVGGLLVPFRQEESIDGEMRYVFQLSRVSFNVGLSDLDFDLSVGQD